MSGCRVVWRADIQSRPEVGDIRPYLDQAIQRLRGDRHIAGATYQHDPWEASVTFTRRVSRGVSENQVERDAHAALKSALPVAGFATKHFGPTDRSQVAVLHFTCWPSQFLWR